MTTATARVLALLVWALPMVALADPPPESFTLVFDGTASIWNPFDDFEACESVAGAELCLRLEEVVCDGRGRCRGAATWEFSGVLDGVLTGTFTAAAKCKLVEGKSDVCKAAITGCDTAGEIDIAGFATIDSCKIKGNVASDGSFDASGSARVCIDEFGCANAGGVFPYAVNPPAPWMVMVELNQTDDSAYEATATDTLGFEYVGKAKHNGKSDVTTLSLKGVQEKNVKENPSRGAKVTVKALKTAGDEVTGGVAKFSVQGNKGVHLFD